MKPDIRARPVAPAQAVDPLAASTLRFARYGRHWAVYEGEHLVCVTMYKKGAVEVVRRLTAAGQQSDTASAA